ncbi:hypothetical protein MANES_18G104700v8 [Manihot esculenta]|uniref:Uncharacterized protein n=1 Tax=Manihot esculenta TaxID=3983 RepID=A0ACB7G030_MANES|nr:hypothetical protein MANES_18G104700v8 [Manihot esculenta]
MQPTPLVSGNSSRGGGGGSELIGSGLARFRSAPATWLEALLEDEEEEDPLKPNRTLTQLLASNNPTRNSVPLASSSSLSSSFLSGNLFEPTGFQRQNSSPADFLGDSGPGSDGYFSSFGIPSNYDYISPMDVSPSGEKAREVELHHPSTKYPSLLKGEQSGRVAGEVSTLMEMEIEKLLEDSVPYRVRAKRGCATHPRSIAERVRRTRISDRIRKLQELVPNMDKIKVRYEGYTSMYSMFKAYCLILENVLSEVYLVWCVVKYFTK